MKRIRSKMFRYGDHDFDSDYLNWGFHNQHTQIQEAQSILNILGPKSSLKILDLACGIGTHAIYWAKQDHQVVAVDISEKFITTAKETASREVADAQFVVGDIAELDYREEFDLITWIEGSFFGQQVLSIVHSCLRQDGHFVCDVRNPENLTVRQRQGNWRTWREENGLFYLERHEANSSTGEHEDVWIVIDPQHNVIEEKKETHMPISLEQKIERAQKAGFKHVELRTLDGEIFAGGPEPYWLWLVAAK